MSSESNGSSFPNPIAKMSEGYFEKLFCSASKVNLKSLQFLDPLSLKLPQCGTDLKDLSEKYYLPDILKSESNRSLEDYISLPRIKLDDYSRSINQIFSQKIEETLKNNLQVLLVGASIGAAVTAGVALGLLIVGSIVNTSIPTWFRIISKKITFCYHKWDKDEDKTIGILKDKTQNQHTGHIHVHRSSDMGATRLSVLQGKPEPKLLSNPKSVGDQCRQCMYSISSNLDSHCLTWNEVLKLNIMMVNKGDDRITSVRPILSEYISDLSSLAISVIYVMGLEDPSGNIEIEAWIQSKN